MRPAKDFQILHLTYLMIVAVATFCRLVSPWLSANSFVLLQELFDRVVRFAREVRCKLRPHGQHGGNVVCWGMSHVCCGLGSERERSRGPDRHKCEWGSRQRKEGASVRGGA